MESGTCILWHCVILTVLRKYSVKEKNLKGGGVGEKGEGLY